MKTNRIALTLAAALALSACSGGKDEEAPMDETNVEAMGEPINMTEMPAEAPAAPSIDNSVNETAPVTTPEISADEQTAEDAAAAGMTARVVRNENSDESGEAVH